MRLRSCAQVVTVVLALSAAPITAQAQSFQSDGAEQSTPLSAEEAALLERVLQYDSAMLATAPAKSLKAPKIQRDKTFDVSRTESAPDGSGTVVVRQTVLPDWDAKVGADLNLAGNNPVTYQPNLPLDAYSRRTGAGAAWASIDITDNATVDARLDPNNDQGRIGGTLKHSMPVGKSVSVTLQNRVSVTETYGAPALPQDGGSGRAQVIGSEQAVRFKVAPTGTTLGATLLSSSDDPITRNTLSAEQKLVGPLSVTTSVSDVGQPTVSKSITAGFKLKW